MIYCIYKVKRCCALIKLESVQIHAHLEAELITNNCTYVLAEIALLFRTITKQELTQSVEHLTVEREVVGITGPDQYSGS